MARDGNDLKKARAKLWWALIIIFLMFSSTIAFVYNFFGSNSSNSTGKDSISYNGYKFSRNSDNGVWQTNYNGVEMQFNYLPNELEDLNIDDFDLDKKRIYLAFNASNSNQIILSMYQRIKYSLILNNIAAYEACISEQNCPDIPIVDCKNSDYQVIYFKPIDNSERQKMTDYVTKFNDGSCYIVESNSNGFYRISDKMIYKILGII